MLHFKTILCNFLYQFEKTIDTIREILLKIGALFLAGFSIVFGIGIAILMLIKIKFILFPNLASLAGSL